MFMNIVRDHIDRTLEVFVYNAIADGVRLVRLNPQYGWGGKEHLVFTSGPDTCIHSQKYAKTHGTHTPLRMYVTISMFF